MSTVLIQTRWIHQSRKTPDDELAGDPQVHDDPWDNQSSIRVFYRRSRDSLQIIRQQGVAGAGECTRVTKGLTQIRVKAPRKYMELFIPPQMYRVSQRVVWMIF